MTVSMSRRAVLKALGAGVALAGGGRLRAEPARPAFGQWVESFRARARARGVSDATYSRVMGAIKPDTSVYALDRAQPEFREEVWQYLNRRVSDWRIETGKERAREHAALLERIERDYGVDRYIMLGLWGMEFGFGDVVVNPKHMRPIIPALAALAWGEPRRRAYWEQELLNALVIVERGWANPGEMIGSWAGAMGHTQWMPEVWLNMGVDFNGDGRISPFGPPDDALAGTAQYLLRRGKYRRGEGWGYEVRLPAGVGAGSRGNAGHLELAGARGPAGERQAVPAAERAGAAVAAGRRRAGVSRHAEFLCDPIVQSGQHLRACHPPPRRPHPRRAGRSFSSSRAASARRRWPRCRRSSAASPRSASIPTARTAGSVAIRCSRCAPSSARSGSSPPTATPA